MAIDVPHALKKRNSPDNMLLMDGDQITVPVRSSVVTVRGAVNAPNVVAYVPGKDIDYYISLSGGPAREADMGRAFITQPNGKREVRHRWSASQPKPLPGALVVVPQIDPATRTNWLTVFATLTPIVASLASLILAVTK